MHKELLGIFACPESGGNLELEIREERNGHVYTGALISQTTGKRFAIERFIPRLVPESNYADNFGFQWNRFRQTQLDSFSGTRVTADRFWAQSGWRPEDLDGKRVLDIGCGAGRFAEIALDAGANVVALDFSTAVDACLENHRERLSQLDVIQGNIYHLPFKPAQFDFVYCFGVLQHTSDVKASFMAPPSIEIRRQACGGYLSKTLEQLGASKILAAPIDETHAARQAFFTGGIMRPDTTGRIIGDPFRAIDRQVISSTDPGCQLFRRPSSLEGTT